MKKDKLLRKIVLARAAQLQMNKMLFLTRLGVSESTFYRWTKNKINTRNKNAVAALLHMRWDDFVQAAEEEIEKKEAEKN
jgi:hypothetical protein